MDDRIHLVIEIATGLVVDGIIGVRPMPDGLELVARDGAAADAWIGWSRQMDGSFLPPEPPEDGVES